MDDIERATGIKFKRLTLQNLVRLKYRDVQIALDGTEKLWRCQHIRQMREVRQ
jgi:hypothetical protein